MLIGLDLGTTKIGAGLWDTERATAVRTASRRNDSDLPTALPTRAEQDPRRIYALALEVLAELSAAGLPVDGIALTGQMHAMLCLDADGEPLTSLISWQDRRTAEAWPGGSTALDEIHTRLAGHPWPENGCRIAHGYAAATLFWLVQRGALPPQTKWICSLPGWLAARLTGRPPMIDPTLAASWGAYHLRHARWDAALLERLDLDSRLFPPLRPAGVQVGALLPHPAAQAALIPGIPVFNPVGDHQAAFLATVAEPATTVHVNLGTGGQVAWLCPAHEPATERVETRPLPGGGALRVGASLCGGAAYGWLNQTVRRWLAEFGLEVDEETAYRRLNALAATAPDGGGLHVRTTFQGIRGDPSIRTGAIDGITLTNLDLGALARAILLGLIDEIHDIYRTHGGTTAGHCLLVASGNAVQKNPLLPGLLSERFGLPIETPRWAEPAAVGAAMAVGLGGQPLS